MKSLNFKHKEGSQLRFLEEKISGKTRSRLNWDRYVYLVILALIVFFVLRYFFYLNFYISANGQVLFESTEISHTEDLRIEKFFVSEGDNIQVGDTLFTYVEDGFGLNIDNLVVEQGDNRSSWADREIFSLKKSISLNNSQIAGDETLMASYKKQLRSLENEVILGAANERDLNNLEYQITKLETAINLSRTENAVLNKQILLLESKQNETNSNEDNLSIGRDDESPYRAFLSPIEGYIARIFKEPFEVALKSQLIMKIHQADLVHIKGYFEQFDLKHVKEGDIVKIDFPDGTESNGVIERFYSSTVLIPEEFQKRFEPAKRTIAVDIGPADGADLSSWKRYYKLSVKLSKRTF